MSVNDRWHKSRPRPGEPLCHEHGKVATTEHGAADQWQVRWRDETGTQRKRNFAKKANATSFDAEMRTRLDSGTSINLAAGKQPASVYAAAWRANLSLRPSTAERLERVFRLHLDELPVGRMAIASVRASHMRAWIKDRSAVLAPSTLAVVWANVASMFAAAALDRVIGVSPCAGVKAPSAEKTEHFIPTADQVYAVTDALPERYKAIAWVAAGCGWRRNEILGAEFEAVDFLRRTAEVRQQLLALAGQPMCLAPPKTPTSYRVSELPEVVSVALARHLEQFPAADRPIWDRTDPRRPVERRARLLFVTKTGAPVHPAWWATIWREAADTAGIPAGVGIHCLRHYFATLLIHQGADVKTVQLAMGHATPMITLNTYAGEWPDAGGRTRSIIDAALGSVPAQRPDLEARR